MFRLLFVLLLSCLSLEISAQVQKSTDIVVIRGKNYYLHTVQVGQTLYSICKAYGVPVDELKRLNDKQDDSLSPYEVLKVPYIEQVPERDGKYYYHRVEKGETLYSIARHYGIKPKRLLKHNNNYSANKPLAIGDIVRMPLNEIDLAAIPETLPVVQAGEGYAGKPSGNQDSRKNLPLVSDKTFEREQDTLPVQSTFVHQEQPEQMPDYLSEVVMPSDAFVKVALVLPFFAGEYPLYQDTLPDYQAVKISPRSEQFVNFYEGILLAVDSLKTLGYKVDLHVFDSERSTEKMYSIASELDILRPDLILGPVYASEYKVLADNMEYKHAPLVYPLSSRGGNLGAYSNFVQVNASFEVLVEKMVLWLEAQSKNANIIHVRTGNEGTDADEKRILQEQLGRLSDMQTFVWNVDQISLDALRTMLLPDRENILVMPTTKEADVSKILPVLSALSDGYHISVVGLPEWQHFTSVDHETYYKLNTRLFMYSYIDYQSEAAKRLSEKYRKYFYTEPATLVFKAFDMGMYFIELAAKYRDRTLESIPWHEQQKDFSRFHFGKMPNASGLENQAFYIVHFASDYTIKVEKP